MFDGIHAGFQQVIDGVGGEGMDSNPATGFVNRGDGVDQNLARPQRAQIRRDSLGAVDPVTHNLDPSVRAPQLAERLGREVTRFNLHRQVAEITQWAGDVLASTYHLG